MADYDAIVVGAGLAGCTAAYCLAREGLSVLMLERGNAAGAKNMTGGRLYAHSLEAIMPDFASSAPVERKVVKERIGLLTEESSFTMDFTSPKLGVQGSTSYTVLRASFDAWLAARAEEAGCDFICPARVDSLLRSATGQVEGVRAGEDELTADVVILADGVNSLLAQQAGLKRELTHHQVAVGVKELIELPKGVIEDRFGLNGDEGAACLFAGHVSDGMVGGGFLYTNRESLSLGLVVSLADLPTAAMRVPDLLQRYREHPTIAPLVAGGKCVEYSAHLVPEAGLEMMPELVAPGLLVVGDAAGLCMNLGYTVRGMDLAIASGALAAQAVAQAKQAGDFSKASLARYTALLEDSFVMRDLATFRNAPRFVEQSTNIYQKYPQLLEKLLLDVFTVNGPSRKMSGKMRSFVAQAGLFNLLGDGWRALRSL